MKCCDFKLLTSHSQCLQEASELFLCGIKQSQMARTPSCCSGVRCEQHLASVFIYNPFCSHVSERFLSEKSTTHNSASRLWCTLVRTHIPQINTHTHTHTHTDTHTFTSLSAKCYVFKLKESPPQNQLVTLTQNHNLRICILKTNFSERGKNILESKLW